MPQDLQTVVSELPVLAFVQSNESNGSNGSNKSNGSNEPNGSNESNGSRRQETAWRRGTAVSESNAFQYTTPARTNNRGDYHHRY